MDNDQGRLVWIDLEMTGLNIQKDVILEIATIITNNSLDLVATGPSYVIHYPDEVLENMNDWCKKYHNKSGLTLAVRESKTTLNDAVAGTLDFIKSHVKIHEAPLCGNSVWNDKLYLSKYMPEIDNYLNYRIIDVSSIKEVIRRWFPDSDKAKFTKPENHRAAEDIFYSIEELRHYKTYFFLPNI